MMCTRFILDSILIVLLSFVVSSCVTSKEKRVEQIRVGMLKDEVLEAAGSPTTFARSQGRDRWIYRVVKGSDINSIEVQFIGGKAVYVGPPPVPALSAEEQDKYNQLYNQKQEAAENRIIEERKKKKRALHPQDPVEEDL